MSDRKCETCRWWERKKDAEGYGSCRIRSIAPVQGHRLYKWPQRTWDDWCGEHAPKEAGDE
jgi:hypothetical protein